MIPIIDPNSFDINGTMLQMRLGNAKKFNKAALMPNFEQFKFKNECVFGNVVEFYREGD